MHIMTGKVKNKKVEVFSTKQEAEEYARTHIDSRWVIRVRPMDVWVVDRLWKNKR